MVAREKGLYKSIQDESLQPKEHLRRALLLRLSGGPCSVEVPEVIVRAINAYSSSSGAELQHRLREAICHWSPMADKLPRRDNEPFHTALVEAMDDELDLLHQGPGRGEFQLVQVHATRYRAAITGVVAYDEVFDQRANLGPPQCLSRSCSPAKRRCTSPLWPGP